MVPTVAPSATDVPAATAAEPRCRRVTDHPSGVRIVTARPCVGTLPTNDTTPPEGAATDAPDEAATSMPRCCPSAYGLPPNTNGRTSAPSTGQVQADARGGAVRARATTSATADRR